MIDSLNKIWNADCGACQARYLDEYDWIEKGLTWPSVRMIVCPECGSKRCTKAANHKNACNKWALGMKNDG